MHSLNNKVKSTESELNSADVIYISETWLDDRTSANDIKLRDYKLSYRLDRQGDNHGNVCEKLCIFAR